MSKEELIVEEPVFDTDGGKSRVSARLHGGGFDRTLWFRSAEPFGGSAALLGEAFTTFALLVAMSEGWPLRVRGVISRRFSESLQTLQRITHTWYPEFEPVEIRPDDVVEDADVTPAAGEMFCFSGGLDSFYTYLENSEGMTHGLMVFGADIALDEIPYQEYVSERLRSAAGEMGVTLVEVETNLLEVTGDHCSWAVHQHGAGLASIAKLFGDRVGKLSIASSYPVSQLLPWGSSPYTDPMWSSNGLEVVLHGAYVGRIQKAERVAQSDLAMRHLRVCFANEAGSPNCCRCEKCLRTMSALRALGALERCPAFALPLDLVAVEEARYANRSSRNDWRGTLELLGDGRDPELEAAIQAQFEKNDAAKLSLEYGRHEAALLASPEWLGKLPKRRNKLFDNLRAHDADWFEGRLAKEVEAGAELAFDTLWRRRRKWLKGKLKQAEAARRKHRWRRALRRIGIGKG